MLVAISIASFVLWIWLIVSAWRVGTTWGLLTLIFWPIALVPLIQTWKSDGDLRLPFFLLLVSSIVQTKLWLDQREQQQALLSELGDESFEQSALAEAPPADTGFDDEIAARIRWQQTIDNLSYRHGEIELRPAKAALELPESFRFIGRASVDRVLKVMGEEAIDELQGWVIHQSVNLVKDDAWAIEVLWWDDGFLPLRSLATLTADELWADALVANAELSALNEAQGYWGHDLLSYGVPPTAEGDLVYWAKRLAFDDGSTSIDCHALKRGRNGWLEFTLQFMPVEQLELCLRSVRLIAARADYEHGSAARDASRRERNPDYSLVDVITGRQQLLLAEAEAQ